VTAVAYPVDTLVMSIGKETTEGVPVTPTHSVPVLSCTPVDSATPQRNTAWSGSAAATTGFGPGPQVGGISLAGHVYADTIGYPLAGILGDVTTTTGTPNTHTISLNNAGAQQPPSDTIYCADAYNCLVWAGVNYTSLSLTSDVLGTFDWSASALCLPGAAVAAPSSNYTSAAMFGGWRGVVTIGGVADGRVISSSTVLSRTVAAQRPVTGQQLPARFRTEQLTVAGTITAAMTDDAYRLLYLAGSSTSVDVLFSQGSGAATQSVRLHSSAVTLMSAVRSRGSRYLTVALTWEAAGSTADAGASGGTSPLRATLRNTVGAGIYA